MVRLKLLVVLVVSCCMMSSLRGDLETQRIDCYPEAPYLFGAAIDQKCVQRNCIWRSSAKPNVPWCFFPQDHYGYTSTSSSMTGSKERVNLKRLTTHNAPFANPIENLVLEADYINPKVLRVKIYDASKSRYEVPLELNDIRHSGSFQPELYFSWENRASDNVFQFKIIRRSTKAVLFDTSIGGMVFEDQFLQIATILPNSSNVYGFGQNNHPSLSHDLNYKTWGMWARDEPNVAGEELNQYGVHPVFNVLEHDGNAYGVALINSNAQEYSFTPNPALIMRSIGGIFDFYFFAGPGPEAVVQQFTSLVGHPIMIPYFALGFQLSRWNYQDLNDMKRIVQRNLDKGIPLDIQYADIEYMQDQMDFTIHETKFKDLPAYFKELQSKGMHVVPILDPALLRNPTYKPYSTGLSTDVYIKFPAGLSPDSAETGSDIMLGWCWPIDKVVYPDFMLDRAEKWWIDEIIDFKTNISYDAIWIDMNEPAVFDTNEEKPWNWPENRPPPYWTLKCPVNRWDDPPYRTKAAYRYDAKDKPARLSQKTLCLVGLQKDGAYRHYDVHNLYGLFESKITMKAVRQATGKRSFVLSRSTFIGSGRYTGSWLGDNDSSWKDLHRSIIGMIESGIFGIPYIGADICGFTSTTNEELCTRWQQIGAFYPYSRNHNVKDAPDQDPAAFSQAMIDSTIAALNIRYEILPYFYTLFYRAHVGGNLVVRGLWQEFPYDDKARTIDKQFLVGPAWLVSGVVENGKRTVDVYLPSQTKWYSYYDGSVAPKGYATLNAPLNFIHLHIRGGYIIPTQKPDKNTSFSRKNPFGLIVALDANKLANGELFWDDGDSIDSIENSQYFLAKFLFTGNKLSMIINENNYAEMDTLTLDHVRLLGFADTALNRADAPLDFTIEVRQAGRLQTLEVTDFTVNQNGEVKLNNLNLKMNEDFEIYFKQVILPEVIDVNDERLRSDCFPEAGATQSNCEARGCTWKAATITGQDIPWCFISKTRASYTLQGGPTTTPGVERTTSVYKANKVVSNSFYGDDFATVKISVELKGAKQARIKIEDDANARFEVPVKTSWKNAVKPEEGKLTDNDFDIRIESDSSNRFVIEVFRKSTNSRLFSTREYAESYVFSDRYIQFYARLPTENAYGFGESTHEHFRHRFTHEDPIYPVFARDEPPAGGARALYGTQPFYMCVEQDGSAHGLLILNSNAQEYRFTSLRTFMYRTLGGVVDIYLFSGPTPENVIQQYAKFIGTPFMPPYYALGFQVSKYGYNNLATLQQMINRNVAANIPFDIQYGDIDHFEKNKDFTYDAVNFPNLPQYLDSIRTQHGIRFIPIVDPALVTNEPNYQPYVRGMASDVWIKWPSDDNPQSSETVNRNMLGYVWPEGKVLFPDFFKNATIDWWSNEIALYYNTFKFAGLWIDMNEPANFGTNQNKPFNWPDSLPPWSLKCPNSKWDDPPYRTKAAWGERLSDKTLCLVGVQTDGVNTYRQYDTHNLFGYTQTIATFEALRRLNPNKRPLIITRSNFPGSGTMAGHWLGDNTSNWKHLKYNLIGVLEYNLFLMPYIGADICGFFGDADAELCERWMQLGAFNPFFRNHNGLYGTPQDPAAFGPTIAESMRKTIVIRYTLNPYLYTLFSEVHQNGGTVVRSLTHEFPQDKGTLDIDEQFLWGSALLISPVIHQGMTTIQVYFPPEARWYSYYDGREVTVGFAKLSAPRDFIPLHVRGGYILPTQEAGKNTDESRKNPFGLIIAPGFDEKASGSLYWDDGESYDSISGGYFNLYRFNYQKVKNESVIDITIVNQGYPITNKLNTIRLFDVIFPPENILVNSVPIFSSYVYDQFNEALEIYSLNLSMDKNYKIEIFY